MKITGYKLREALRRWQLRRDTAGAQFGDTLTAFPGEEKLHPDDVAKALIAAEAAIAQLQVAQVEYNSRVYTSLPADRDGHQMNLLECVKIVGGLQRVQKLWKDAAKQKGGNTRWILRGEDANTRDKDKLVAKRIVSFEGAGKRALDIDRHLSAYREAMAVANATERDIENLTPALFE